MRKKILVTGGSGYQGVKLIKKLIDNNYSVINIDNNREMVPYVAIKIYTKLYMAAKCRSN